MTKSSVTFKDLYQIIGDFRKENNERFDRIENIFSKHCDEQNKIVEKFDTRVSYLEKIADRALFFILITSGIVAAVWQLTIGWIKKELKI